MLLKIVPVLLLSAAGLAIAGPAAPVFGPESFELTAEDGSFAATFAAALAGPHILHLHNGDGETSRVDDVSVAVNGVVVIRSGEVDAETPAASRPVDLLGGDNQLVVDLAGAPGSFVTVVIAPAGPRPKFVAGRLLLPWGRNDGDRVLALSLKNGSPQHPRRVRVVFFRPDGTVAAASEKFALPPRGSVALPVAELIDAGAWTVGSVEVFFAGPGAGRLFGSATQVDLPPVALSETQPLELAGVVAGLPDPERPGRPWPPRRQAP